MLLAKRGNEIRTLDATVVRISSAPVFYLGAGAASRNFNHIDKKSRDQLIKQSFDLIDAYCLAGVIKCCLNVNGPKMLDRLCCAGKNPIYA